MSTKKPIKTTKTIKPKTVEKEAPSHEICINPEDFDPSRVVLHPPEKVEFNINDMLITNYVSKGKYLDDEGNECTLYVRLPEQQTYGVSYSHDLKVPKEERTAKNAKGLQICYPLTSLKTAQNPTPKEQATKDIFRGLWQATVDSAVAELENKKTLMPKIAIASLKMQANSDEPVWEEAVKFPFSHPKDKLDKKKLDTTKPETIYMKLVSSGSGETLRAQSQFYGPGDKPVNPIAYVNTPGLLTPCVLWEGAYYGTHGSEASHGTSLRFKIVQANFTPKSFSNIPTRRMLEKNSASAEEDPEEDDGLGGEEPEEGTFEEPGKDASDPVAALNKNAGKAKVIPAKKVGPSVAVVKPAAKKVAAKTITPVVKKGAAAKVVAPKAKAVVKKAPPKPVSPLPSEDEEEEIVDDGEEVVDVEDGDE